MARKKKHPKKDVDNIAKKNEPVKKVWTKKDFAEYYKESRELSDYTCSKNGTVKSRYSKS